MPSVQYRPGEFRPFTIDDGTRILINVSYRRLRETLRDWPRGYSVPLALHPSENVLIRMDGDRIVAENHS